MSLSRIQPGTPVDGSNDVYISWENIQKSTDYAKRLASLGHTDTVPKPFNTVIVIGDDINVYNRAGIKEILLVKN
jgi:hypothetical protein